MIIFLNGSSSSGKTSTAEAFQKIYPTPFLNMGIDTLFRIMPERFGGKKPEARMGWFFEDDVDEKGPIVHMRAGEYGKRLWRASPPMVKVMADAGYDIILDEIVFNRESLYSYAHYLRKHRTYFVGLTCPENIIVQREIDRGNRTMNHARAQLAYVHKHGLPYDIEFDSSKHMPAQIARHLHDFIQEHPYPEAFASISKVAEGRVKELCFAPEAL